MTVMTTIISVIFERSMGLRFFKIIIISRKDLYFLNFKGNDMNVLIIYKPK
jgi:hypothetical protein